MRFGPNIALRTAELRISMLKAAKSKNQGTEREASAFPEQPITTLAARIINRVADSPCPILIVGEPGSGKRTLARRIHGASSQSPNEFLEISCRTATDKSLGSAVRSPGTLYFVEIADLSLSTQTSLMEDYFRSNGPQPVCRILAATSRNLQEEIRARRMREDLFYAIGSVSIQTFPLRYRKYEIVEAANEFLDKYAIMFGRPKPVLSHGMVSFMLDYDWPGNFRELETAAKTLVAIGDESITIAALRASATKSKVNGEGGQLSLKQASRAASLQVERELISEVLTSTGWNRKQAARELHISYKALLYKIRQIGMENTPTGRRNGHMQ
jgi:two-component system response regulator AtoC